MRFGFPIPTRGALGTAEPIRRLAEAAEAVDYDSIWVTDHVVLPRQTAGKYPCDPAGRWDLEEAQHYLEPPRLRRCRRQRGRDAGPLRRFAEEVRPAVRARP